MQTISKYLLIPIIVLFTTSLPVLTAPTVKCGIDNLVDTDFALLKGMNIVLVSHAAARAHSGETTTDLFRNRSDFHLLRVLTPEHGFYGVVPAGNSVVDDTVDGLATLSLYGALRKPSKSMLENADAVVLDLQDIGVRSYTYISTMTEVMEACTEYHVPLIILDRPNPIGGNIIDGIPPDSGMVSFVARLPIPYVHGMTIGELATMINGEGWLSSAKDGKKNKCDLTVVKCKRWTRSMRWEETGLSWYPTSPNIPNIESVRGYSITGLAGELGLFSIGIGTTTPFCLVGSPTFLRDSLIENRLSRFGVIPRYGVFMPTSGKFAHQLCHGYYLAFSNDSTFLPFRAAIALITTEYQAMKSRHELDETSIDNESRTQMFTKAIGTKKYITMLLNGTSYSTIDAVAGDGRNAFIELRRPYLLY